MSKKFTVLMDRTGKILSGPAESRPLFFAIASDGVAFIGESDLSEQRAIESAERARQRYLAKEPHPMTPPRITDSPINLWAIVDPDGKIEATGRDEKEIWAQAGIFDRGRPDAQARMQMLFAVGYRAVRLACTVVDDPPSA